MIGMGQLTYAPLLRWKQAERLSLRDLYPGDADGILPVVEVVPRIVDSGNLTKLPQQLNDAWRGRHMVVDGSPPAVPRHWQAETVYSRLSDQALLLDVGIAPVVVPQDDESTLAAATRLSRASQGRLALRVSSNEAHLIPGLLRRINRKPESTDLIVDFGMVGRPDGRYTAVAGTLPLFDQWGSVIFLGGAFPRDLSELEVGQHVLPRHDWLAWKEMANSWAGRRPLFGDYTIQCAVYSEPPEFANFSASIRYTASEEWVVMRGEGVRNATGAGYAQWPANAELLCERSEFCGAAFSRGDGYIEMMGGSPPSTGNPSSWLRAGINHHLSLVSRQAANLL